MTLKLLFIQSASVESIHPKKQLSRCGYVTRRSIFQFLMMMQCLNTGYCDYMIEKYSMISELSKRIKEFHQIKKKSPP